MKKSSTSKSQNKTENALKESERVKSELFEEMNAAQHIAMIGSWEWNLKTNHVSWSDETYRIFGVTRQNFVPSFEANGKFIHPDDVERYSKSFEHSIQTGEPLDVNLRLVTNDGLLKHCNGKGKIIYDDSGQPIRFIGTLMDITERKLAEEALRNSEAFLNNIIDQSPVPMWISDDKGILIRINKACCSMLKITEQDIIGKYSVIEDNLVKEQGLLSDVRRVFDNGETVRFEIRYNTSKLEGFSLESEAEVILDTTIFPIKDYKGKVTNAVIQHMDITERKIAEEALRKSEIELRTILDATPFPLALVDVQDNNINFWSHSALTLFGHTAPTAKEWYEIAYPDPDYRQEVIDRWKPLLEEARQSKRVVNTGEYRVTCRDGSVRICELYVIFLAERLIITFNDITDRKQTEKALRESERKFRDTIKYLDQGYYSCMMDGIVLEHNQAFNKVLGIDISKDMKGSKLPDFWQNPDDRKVYLQELMTRGIIMNYLINAKKISGEKVVVMVNSHLVKNEQGNPVRIEGTFTDFTRLKHMEEALKESEVKYRTLFENAQVGMYRSKIDGSSMLDVNKKFGEILGLTREESLGKAGRILWADPEDRNKMMKLLEEQDGILYNYEARLLAKNGEVRDVLASIELKPGDGSLDGTFVDITDRKLAEEQLRKLNRIYSFLSDINQAIVRSRVPEELFEKACNIAVEQGGFGMAWIGLIDESSQKLQVIAQAGRSNGYFEHTNISLNGESLSYCPIDSALRQGKHSICKIIENKEIAPCQKIAYGLGFRSSASFPLKVSDILKGALTFYSDEPDFFDEAELKLLDELALDISFAMEYAEKEAERKLAEEALLASEVRSRSYIEATGHIGWVTNADGEIVEDVPSLRKFNGQTYEEAKGSGWAKTLHPDDLERSLQVWNKAVVTKSSYEIEYRMRRHDGVYRHMLARGFPVFREDGSILEWVGACIDITERKQAEETLRESEAKYKTLVENIPQKIFMKDRDYRWMSINENFARDLGISPEDIVGKVDYDYFSRDLADKYRADDVRIIKTGKTEELEEKYMVDGKETWVNTIKTPVRDKNGEIVGVLGIFWDITERKLAVEEIRKLNAELEDRVTKRTAQLEATNKELEAFSYSVSHDLRAPLRHVSGYVELLHKHFQSELPEKGQHYLNSIADSIHIMGMLIDDLLQFSRTGRMEMHQSDFDMNEIVKEVKESLSKDNPDRKIEWVLGKLPSINGDEAMLRLVWINLLSNAVKFTRTRQKARIEIGVRKEKKELVFFVRDNGVGFDMKYAQKLFGVFQRLHATEEFEGTGIGLANVQRIVQRHGGRTWAEAEPDKGAVFYFSIPNK